MSGKIEKHEVYQVDNYHVISSAEPSSGRIMYYYDDIDEDGDSEDVGDLNHKSMICWALKWILVLVINVMQLFPLKKMNNNSAERLHSCRFHLNPTVHTGTEAR